MLKINAATLGGFSLTEMKSQGDKEVKWNKKHYRDKTKIWEFREITASSVGIKRMRKRYRVEVVSL